MTHKTNTFLAKTPRIIRGVLGYQRNALATITTSLILATLLSGCAGTYTAPKMSGMWAERFEGNKSLEVWARMSPSGQQEALVLFVEPKNDGSDEYVATCGAAGKYQPVAVQNGAFQYDQDRLNATVQRIRNNRLNVQVNSGCIPSGDYLLLPIRQSDIDISAQDSLKKTTIQ